MKRIVFSLLCFGALAALAGCAHDPNKAEKIDTAMNSQGVVAGETVGIKDGKMVVQKKMLLSEELRDLQYEVFELEDHVYGNEKYGSKGLYGVLKTCKLKLSDKANGGDGKLTWTEPIDRVTDKEDDMSIGVDEQNKLVAVSEEYIKDRIARFQQYKQILLKRQNEYEDKIEVCNAALRSNHEDKEGKEQAGN
jgi:hypothetical protein